MACRLSQLRLLPSPPINLWLIWMLSTHMGGDADVVPHPLVEGEVEALVLKGQVVRRASRRPLGGFGLPSSAGSVKIKRNRLQLLPPTTLSSATLSQMLSAGTCWPACKLCHWTSTTWTLREVMVRDHQGMEASTETPTARRTSPKGCRISPPD